jgi:hypothetical protein
VFVEFFYLLRAYGVPVTVTEWLMFSHALAHDLAGSSLTSFYDVGRACLVKSEAFFDQYDQAFQHMFQGVETPQEIADEVWDWLADPLAQVHVNEEERRALLEALADIDLEGLRRSFEERLREQTEAHHGGDRWVGTGGTSAFGHSGWHPGGIRVGGHSSHRSAVKVAGERRYRSYRTDAQVDVRQFELALRRLRRLSARNQERPDELDLDATVRSTADHGGLLSLEYQKSRKNTVKLLVLMDVGGSMDPFVTICSRLFTALNRATHLKDLRFLYFHNCVYDHLFNDASCSTRNAVDTTQLLNELSGDYKLILVGDAAMAPSELKARHGIIWWGQANEEPGIEWLQRLRRHFPHSVWLNTIVQAEWDWAYGHRTIAEVRRIFPMFELTVDGLTAAVSALMVRR